MMKANGTVPVVIGITGHRKLREQDGPVLRQAVRHELERIRDLCPDSELLMLNSLAEGADQLCAETAMEMGIPVTAVLPMPVEEYEMNFRGEPLEKFRHLLAACGEVMLAPHLEAEPMELPGAADYADSAVTREYLYRQAGLYAALHSHVLIALWDGVQGDPAGCGTYGIFSAKRDNTCIDREDRRIHLADGFVIQVTAPRSGSEGTAGAVVLYGDRERYEKMLRETDAYNRDVRNAADTGRAAPEAAEQPSAVMERLEQLYSASDGLSVRNGKLHHRILAALAVAATLLTMAFLLYDEAELFWMIDVCGVMIIVLFGINAIGRRLRSHDRYLQYRILAECARVQTYMETACVPCDVSEILPWSLQVQIPWIRYAMAAVVISGEEARYARKKDAARTVLESWVHNQKTYHEGALRRSKAQLRANDRIVRIALILTILVYVLALAFEIRFGGLAAGGPAFSEAANNTIRMWFKIAMGTLSAGTLFTSNYYGKLALPNVIDDHRKMVLLYHEAEKVIERDGETPEILIRLAEDELQENSNWYAYQSMNDADINI